MLFYTVHPVKQPLSLQATVGKLSPTALTQLLPPLPAMPSTSTPKTINNITTPMEIKKEKSCANSS